MDGRECTECNQYKPLTEFYEHSRGLYGRAAKCKACKRSYYEATRSRRLEYQNNYNKLQRALRN